MLVHYWALVPGGNMFRLLLAFGALAVLAAPSPPSRSVARNVRVVALDYAFQSPDTLAAGMATFSLENRGKVLHEVFIARLSRTVSVADFARASQQLGFRELAKAHTDGIPPGVIFALPGETSPARLSIALERGRTYMLFCNLRDTPEAQRHNAMGMFRAIVVK